MNILTTFVKILHNKMSKANSQWLKTSVFYCSNICGLTGDRLALVGGSADPSWLTHMSASCLDGSWGSAVSHCKYAALICSACPSSSMEHPTGQGTYCSYKGTNGQEGDIQRLLRSKLKNVAPCFFFLILLSRTSHVAELKVKG